MNLGAGGLRHNGESALLARSWRVLGGAAPIRKTPVMRIQFVFPLLAVLVCGGCQTTDDFLSTGLDARAAATDETLPPLVHGSSVTICHGYGCRLQTPVALGSRDRATMARLMASGRRSAAAERQAVARVVAWFDKRIGPEAGTAGRVARAGLETIEDPGQMDCVDASRNTTSVLRMLEQAKLLRFHDVGAPVARGALIDGRWPHATAVLREKKDKGAWSVDLWVKAYGERPEIKPLDVWMKEG